MIRALVLVLVLIAAGPAVGQSAKQLSTVGGLLSACEEYTKPDGDQFQGGWCVGFMQGISVLVNQGYHLDSETRRLGDCLPRDLFWFDVRLTFRLWAKSNPALHDMDAAKGALTALRDHYCPG